MNTKKLFGLGLLTSGVFAFLFFVLPTQPAAAETPRQRAEGVCQAKYPSNSVLKNACINGHVNGNGSGATCNRYGNRDEQSACRTGYNLKTSGATPESTVNYAVSNRCDVSGLGWIVCQVSRFIGWVADGLFRVLEKMLTTPSLDQNQAGGRETYKVWSMFRNIANVVLVLVFLSVILSQVTNLGINNYGIKKLLPRMIVGAVLINLSFIICGLVVDLSNVAGTSLKDILVSVAIPVKPDFSAWSTVISGALVGASAALIYLNIFAIFPVLVSGLVALLMTVVILIVRQALLITLVIIAPVAFALNILPSTQKWFSKWWSSFIILACVFPVVAFIFGATRVAAGVISASAPTGTVETIIFGVFSLGVQSIPFFITPLLMKFGGGLLNRFTGIVNDPSKGLIDRGRKRVDQWSQNKTKLRETNALVSGKRGFYRSVTRRRDLTDQVAKHHKNQLKNHTSGAYGEFISSEGEREKLAERAARASGKNIFDSSGRAKRAEDIEASLGDLSIQLEVRDIDAAEAVLIDNNATNQDLRDMIDSGINKDGSAVTEDEKNAAIRRLAKQGNVDDIHRLIGLMDKMQAGALTLKTLADAIDASGVSKHAAHLGPRGTQMLRSSGGGHYASVADMYKTAAAAGAYNAETLASENTKSLRGLGAVTNSEGFDAEIRKSIQQNREAIKKRDKLQGRVSPNAENYLNRL